MKNWTFEEAVKVIIDGKNKEAVNDITTRYPDFALAVAKNDIAGVAALFSGIQLSLGSLEMVEKDESSENKKEEAPSGSYDEMSVKDLIELCDKKGIKVPRAGRNKQFYIDKINKAKAAATGKEEVESREESKKEAVDPYKGKTAKELHTMLKERGIKAEIRKPVEFYAELLRKDDASKEDLEPEDDWGEEDELPINKPAKGSKQKLKKEQDDADDWVI